MEKVDFQEIVDNAVSGKKWHFHMLGRGCKFNDNRDKFSIIFENEENGESFYCVFDDRPRKESKKLADLMYGYGFLEKQEKSQHNPDFDLILKNAEELTEQGSEWHHHHLPPNCMFNKHNGKHCIVFEDSQKVLIAVYAQKPMGDLVKIEKLVYNDVI